MISPASPNPTMAVTAPGNGWIHATVYGTDGLEAGQFIMPEAAWDVFGVVDNDADPPTLTVTSVAVDEPPAPYRKRSTC